MNDALENNEGLSPANKRLGNIIAGFYLIACGIFLLLCGIKVIPLSVTNVFIASVLSAVGLTLLTTSLIQKNSISLWLSFAFLLPALVEILVKSTSAGYSQLYPIYIAIPAISSFFTMFLTREWRDHIMIILFFGVIAFIFALHSFGLNWGIVVPILVIFVGGIILYIALKTKKGNDDEL